MSDVTAVVLTLGEPFTARAIESLANQTLAPHEVVVIQDVSPFFRAVNAAAARVRTPFFIQVDADMILDPGCLAALRGAVREDTGIAVGELRDALAGQVVGIKLFRTECVRRRGFRDCVSPDTDFGAAIRRRGWRTEYIGRATPGSAEPNRTYGEHRPDYTPAYTLRKFLLEGRRLRFRGATGGLRWQLGRLEQSTHPQAIVAQVALAHGFFRQGEHDGLKPGLDDGRAAGLVALLAADGAAASELGVLLPLDPNARLRDTFRRFTLAGRALAQAGAGEAILRVYAALLGAGHDWSVTLAKLGFGHGLLSPGDTGSILLRDERVVEVFLTLHRGSSGSLGSLLLARAARRVLRLRATGAARRW